MDLPDLEAQTERLIELRNINHARDCGQQSFLPGMTPRAWIENTSPPYSRLIYREAWWHGFYRAAALYGAVVRMADAIADCIEGGE